MKNLFTAALLGLLCGTVGETLLFMEAQTRRVEEALCADFRIVAFLDGQLPEAAVRALEASLLEVPGTAGVRFVSRDESLAALRHQDPEMMRSVALLGENPLESAFEVELHPESVARSSEWAEAAAKLKEVGDIRFKPMEVQAIVQAQFFVRFLRLALSLSGFFWLAGAAAGLWAALSTREARGILDGLPSRAAMAGLGAAAGMGLVLVAALPLRSAPAAWAAPTPLSQALLFGAGLLGAFFAWDWGTLGEHARAARDLAAARRP